MTGAAFHPDLRPAVRRDDGILHDGRGAIKRNMNHVNTCPLLQNHVGKME